MKLQLYYPCKPFGVNQGFGLGETDPVLIEKYKSLGIVGHNGMDLYAPDGTLVRAAHDGIVTFTGEDGSGGLGVVLRTLVEFDYEGIDTNTAFYKTIYWHLKKNSIIVKANQQVKAGDVLAKADNTGMSTGSHLHFGLKPVLKGENDWTWWNAEQNNGYGGAVDPAPFCNGIYAETVQPGLSTVLFNKLLALVKAGKI